LAPCACANRASRSAKFDANYWKGFVHARLAVALADKGCLSLYGKEAGQHALFAEHLAAEAPTRVTANGRTVDEWQMKPGVGDNHWLDCLAGCAVGAAILGCCLPSIAPSKPAKQPVSFKEMYDKAQGKRKRAS